MDLKYINTELLLEEIPTDGHSPLKFICENNAIYYCKYLVTLDRSELNFLFFELVSSYLLMELNIPTPKVALVTISEGTLNSSKIKANRRLQEKAICFGSKEVTYANELQSIQEFNRGYLNSIKNLEDLLKIAIFDLWIQNIDRGRDFGDGYNYNLLLRPNVKKNELIAFDHAFTFGGVDQLGLFNPKMASYTNNLLQTPLYKAVCKHLGKSNTFKIVEEFVPLLSQNYSNGISSIFKTVEKEWDLFPNSDMKIHDFLSNDSHIINCHQMALQSLK